MHAGAAARKRSGSRATSASPTSPSARPALALDRGRRVEVRRAGLRALRRDRAACDLLVQPDDRLADADTASKPLVLLVRGAAGDTDQHPEAARIDRVDARVPRELVE